ncbi:MAG: relaxase/mobilization nuclease domain-containing protein, partial [Clostridia bacterium]|nr:relaxase/mobilization nuclease domain-containing protein [Clostridia bacterium]
MAVFRINSERGPVRESVAYVTRDGKLRRVDTLNLMKGRDIVSQFTDVMRLYGKGLKKGEVKTYDFVFSPSAKDGCFPESVRKAAFEIAKTLFPCHQCVIATHTDTRHVHAHILVGAVDMVTGKKLAIDLSELTAMRKTVDEIGKRYGISPWDSRERGERTPGIIDRSYGDYIGFDSRSWLARARANIFFAQMKAQNLVEDGADPHEALKTALDARGIDMRLGKIDGDIVYGVREEGKEVRGAVLGKGFLLSDIDENAGIALKVREMRLEEDFSVLRHPELADWESENVKAMAREAAEWFIGRLLDEAELGRWMQEEEKKEKREEETSARGGEAGVFYDEAPGKVLSGTCEGAGKSGLSRNEWPADAFPEILELFPLFMKAALEGRFESMGRVHDFAAENFQAFAVTPENDAVGCVFENDFFTVPETHALSEKESLCGATD